VHSHPVGGEGGRRRPPPARRAADQHQNAVPAVEARRPAGKTARVAGASAEAIQAQMTDPEIIRSIQQRSLTRNCRRRSGPSSFVPRTRSRPRGERCSTVCALSNPTQQGGMTMASDTPTDAPRTGDPTAPPDELPARSIGTNHRREPSAPAAAASPAHFWRMPATATERRRAGLARTEAAILARFRCGANLPRRPRPSHGQVEALGARCYGAPRHPHPHPHPHSNLQPSVRP
jgi:hypothetical protein